MVQTYLLIEPGKEKPQEDLDNNYMCDISLHRIRPWLNRRFGAFLLHGASAICFVSAEGALRLVLENSGYHGELCG